MRKLRSLYLILTLILSVMLAAGCGKANPADEEVEENTQDNDQTDEAVTSKAEAQETVTEQPENMQPTENAQPASDNESAENSGEVNAEQPGDAEPAVNPASQENTEQTGNTSTAAVTEPADITGSTDNSGLVESGEEAKTETITETVLCDRDGIRITAKELINDWMWGKGMNILIENDTDKNIGLMNEVFAVNDFMITDMFSCGVSANTDQTETLSLCSPGILVIGINTIAEVVISFKVFDNDTGETLFNTDETVIQTSVYGTFEQKAEAIEGGAELINRDGINVIGKYVGADSPWGMAVLLYIDNEAEQDVILQCDEMTVNGAAFEPYFSNQIDRGRKALQTIPIFEQDLAANNITQIKDIVLKFSLGDPVSYNLLYTSDPVRISAGE